MISPPPTTAAAWLPEVIENLEVAAMAAAGEGLDSDPEQEHWVQFMLRQALRLSREARGTGEDESDPEAELGDLDAIDDIARDLRRAAPGDLRDVVSETQLFLLFYLAAHVHIQVIDQARAAHLVTECWDTCAGEKSPLQSQSADLSGQRLGSHPRQDESDNAGPDDVTDDSDDGDEPWPVTKPSPHTPVVWTDEIITAYAQSARPPSLCCVGEPPYVATPGSLLEAATVLALTNRGVQQPTHAILQLIETIDDMEEDVRGMGPEWESMQRIPALAFSMYYVWVHLAIGIADEDQAMDIMQECTARIDEFPEVSWRDPPPGKGGKR